MDKILDAIGSLFYSLFAIVFGILDNIQKVFNMFAGIGDGVKFDGTPITSGQSGTETDTGLLYYLLNTEVVKNLFLSIAILGLFLVIIFTAMAFIKNVYSAKPKNWQDIIGSAIKGLANFIFLPVCCLLGVWLGNILLGAINSATSSGGSTLMSRKLFIACSYNANRIRLLEDEDNDGYYTFNDIDKDKRDNIVIVINLATSKSLTVNDKFDEETKEEYALILDDFFTSENKDNITKYANYAKMDENGMFDLGRSTVVKYYKLSEVNYLVLLVGGIFMMYVLGALSFAMVRRIFILLALYVMSPGLCALYPLDDGKAVGGWKGQFVKTTISAYGAVAGLNIMFSLLPLIDKIEFWADGIIGSLFRLFITVVALFCVKEVIGLINGYIGAEDAYGQGAGLMKNTTKAVTDRTKKYTTGAFRYGTRAINSAKMQDGALRKSGAFFKSLGTSALNDIYGATIKPGYDWVKEGQKQGKTEFEDKRKADSLKELQRKLKDEKIDEKTAFNLARGMGFEKDLAEKIAGKQNEEAWKDAYARGGDLTKVNLTSGDKLLEEKKNLETLEDVSKAFMRASQDLVGQRTRSLSALSDINLNALDGTEARDRFNKKRSYSDEEIQFQLDRGNVAMANDMRTVNEQIEKMKEATIELKHAGSALREPMVAVGKNKSDSFANPEFKKMFDKNEVDKLIADYVDKMSEATMANYHEIAIYNGTNGPETIEKLGEDLKESLKNFTNEMGKNVSKLKPTKTESKK